MAVLLSKNVHLLRCLIFSATVVCAHYFPDVVYRADMLPPEIVATEGFPALGENVDLHDHVTGASCQGDQGNTALVDTTAKYEVAKSWVRVLLEQYPVVRHFYIYNISTEHDEERFLSCETLLWNTLDDLKLGEDKTEKEELLIKRYEIDVHYLNRESDRARWLVKGGIPADRITGNRVVANTHHAHGPATETLADDNYLRTACFPPAWHFYRGEY